MSLRECGMSLSATNTDQPHIGLRSLSIFWITLKISVKLDCPCHMTRIFFNFVYEWTRIQEKVAHP